MSGWYFLGILQSQFGVVAVLLLYLSLFTPCCQYLAGPNGFRFPQFSGKVLYRVSATKAIAADGSFLYRELNLFCRLAIFFLATWGSPPTICFIVSAWNGTLPLYWMIRVGDVAVSC